MNLSGLASKKVAGVPVVYLGAGAAVVLAVIAWQMKANTSGSDATTTGNESDGLGEPGSGGGVTTGSGNVDPYAGFVTKESVTVAPPEQVIADPVIKTNSGWVRDGATYAMTQGQSGSVANAALEKFLRGEDRSYEEQLIVDMVIKTNGLPPDSVDTGGKVGNKPAQKQFTAFPGVHRIKNESDNGFPQLAQLYYNRADAETLSLLRGANPALGANGPWATGTAVKVPAYHVAKYYKVAAGTQSELQIAKKNGISINQLKALNSGMKFPAKVGTSVRVG